jgi:L-ribulose-5-phosphate 4-epimerase
MHDEGYIKYQCQLIDQKLPAFAEFPSLNNWRNKLYAHNLVGSYPNGISFGNLSTRIPGTKQFYITGSATGALKTLELQHYSKVISYDIANNTLTCEGQIKASSEALTHAAIYECDAQINAVIHVHNLDLWKQLLAANFPTTSPKVAYGTPEMANEIKRLFNELNIHSPKVFVMGGHEEGILTFGKDIDSAGKDLEKLLNTLLTSKT